MAEYEYDYEYEYGDDVGDVDELDDDELDEVEDALDALEEVGMAPELIGQRRRRTHRARSQRGGTMGRRTARRGGRSRSSVLNALRRDISRTRSKRGERLPGGRARLFQRTSSFETIRPLGLTTPVGDPVLAGATRTLTSNPQRIFRPNKYIIGTTANFRLTSIKVGDQEMLVGTGDLPAALFSENAQENFIRFTTADIGNVITSTAVNEAAVDQSFLSAFLGTTVQDSPCV